MKEDTRFAGRAKVSFRARIQQPTAILEAQPGKGKTSSFDTELDGDENHSLSLKWKKNHPIIL